MAQFKIRITERTDVGPFTSEYTEHDIDVVRYNWGQLVRAALRETVITVHFGAKLIACRTVTVCWNKFEGNEE